MSIELRASASASRRSPLAARLDVRNDDLSAPAWIDFLSAEIVGYCCRPEERPLFKTSNDNEAAPSPAAAEIAQSSAHCFIASSPHVATAGLALHPGQTRSFLVRCEALPATLPPSFDGSALCCEYVLLVSARTMAPQARGWFSSWSSADSEPWARGPICRLRLPLHLDCFGVAPADGGYAAGAPARCELQCDDLGSDLAARIPAEDDEDDDDGNDEVGGGEDDDDDDEEEDAMEVLFGSAPAAEGVVELGSRRDFRLELNGQPFASVQFVSASFELGGAVRGVLTLVDHHGGKDTTTIAPPYRVSVALLLEEVERIHSSTTNPRTASTRTVAKAELSRGGGSSIPMRTAAFELPIPSHLPCSTTLTAGDSLAAELRWVCKLLFERPQPNADGPLSPAVVTDDTALPWRLPLRVVPSAARRRKRRHASIGRLPAPGLASCVADGGDGSVCVRLGGVNG